MKVIGRNEISLYDIDPSKHYVVFVFGKNIGILGREQFTLDGDNSNWKFHNLTDAYCLSIGDSWRSQGYKEKNGFIYLLDDIQEVFEIHAFNTLEETLEFLLDYVTSEKYNGSSI